MKKLLLYLLLFTSFNLNAQVPGYVPSASLVGWWGFNGNANDDSGNSNDGNVNGATLTSDRLGNANGAYEFDGMDDYILIPDHPDYTFGANDFTISYWAYKLDTIHVDPAYNNQGVNVWNLGSATGTNEWVLHHSGSGTNYANYIIESGTTTYQLISTTNLVISTWYHILGLRDNDSLHLYINGTRESSLFIGNISVNNVGDDMLCAALDPSFAPGTSFSNVILDDIGMWDRALDSCEILDLYNASLGNCCALNPITSQPTNQSTSIGNNATFSFTDNLTGATYQWQMDAGTGYSDLSNAGQFSGTDTQTLTISSTSMSNNNTLYRCVVSESASCLDTTDVVTLTVSESGTSINELNNSLVKLFPNPSNAIITLTLAQHSNGQIILTDILGKEVLSKSFTSNEVQLNLKSLESKGTYFAKVLDSDGNVIAIKKLIYQ